MKRKLLHLFAVCMAMVMAIPIANAAASDYNVAAQTPGTVWKHEFSTPGEDAHQAAVLPNGYIYVIGVNTLILPNGDANVNTLKTLYRINENGVVASSAGYTNIHYGLAADDNGKIVLLDEVWSTATNLDNISIRTPESSGHLAYVDGSHNINLSSGKVPSYTYYFDATGNLENGTGYLWFPPVANQNKLKVAKIVRGTGTTWTTSFSEYTLPFTPTSSNSFIQVYESDEANGTWKFLYLNPGENLYDCTLKNGTITHTTITVPVARKAFILSNAHIFYLGGHKMLAYNTGNDNGSASNKANQFVIYDMTTGTTIATVQPFSKTVSGAKGSIGSWINSLKVSDKQTDLMIFSPAAGASRLSLVATPITAPVTNLKAEIVSGTVNEVKVSWGAPSQGKATKYAISYSINGGAWSADEELTTTSKTYSNQADATYKFRVRAYFGGSSTWGEYTETNSVTIVNYTNPVTNLQVQTSIASPYSAVVNWDLPTEGVPSNYAVSYSNDGGATWSTPVTETAKSHIYSNIAPGQYIFKVVPYYNGSPGEATTQSATVYGISNPVTNITVAYDGNLGNSIVVSWNAPDAPTAPDEYQVSYTSSNGTSKNAVTKNLTYTFSDLTVGTYTFKVTPIYNGFPGEEAFSESISVAEATGFTFTTTKRWEVVGTLDYTSEGKKVLGGKSIAVSNNKMYVAAPNAYGTISYVSESLGREPASWPNFATGFDGYKWGYGMDNDDAGNIIAKTASSPANAVTQLSIYPASDPTNLTNRKDIVLEGDNLPGGRADFIGAIGNVMSSEGGYVWMIPQNANKIVRINIANGKLVKVDTWPQEIYNNSQVVVRPLPDGRLYVHKWQEQYHIITLPEVGKTITADMIETLPITDAYAYFPSRNLSSDLFILKGNTFHVRNDGTQNQSIGVAIRNLTNVGNGDETFIPFKGINTENTESGVTGETGFGSLVRAVRVDENNYDVYCYSRGHGVTVYRVSAAASYIKTDKLTLLDYNYTKASEDNGTEVQSIELVWVAPDEATPSSYKIYRDGVLLTTVDGSTLSYTDKGVTKNYAYKVVPIFTGANENASLGKEVTTTEVEALLYAPEITEVRNYDGYSIVEIFWQMPSYNKDKPAYYNIYRNGVLLETGITQYNYIDDQLPKISDDVEYTYTIEAVYGAAQNNVTRTSKEKTVIVGDRDWGLSGYQLQEVYNIPISPVIGNLPNNFTNEEYYRQGHFYKGSWYIAQLSDQLSRKDQGVSGGAVNQSGIEGATGGVVSIKATEEADIHMGFSNKVLSSEEFASAGLAIDDKGVIFMRHNNISKLEATVPTGSNWVSWLYDAFDRRITEGALYVPDANGNYSSEPTKILDLSALWLDDRWIDNMYFTGATSNGQVKGRSDYFYMYGDVMSAEGGFLLLSPSWTRTIFKVKVANGEYVNHEIHEINKYQDKNGMVDVTVGTGNYGFKLDGRNAWIAQLRSSGYFGIHGEEDNHEESHEHTTHAIFVADSRINNTGGTSIVAFNSAEGANDGETFLITPSSMYSRNYGDFIVTRGTKTNTSDPASEAKLMPPMPVAQMKQTNINTNVNTNASGNWFHAEISTYTNTKGEEAECVDIYQYVPGVRFAKYRLVSDLSLPVVSPTLTITTAYNEDETEITHFNGISTWERPDGFATTDPENASVWIKSYTFELLNANGEVIYSNEVPEEKDADGNPVIDYSFDYVIDKGIDNVDNCDIDFQTYTARIAVNYEFKSGEIQQSSFNYAIASNDYPAKAPNDPRAVMFKQANQKDYVWEENPNATSEDDKWIVVEKNVDAYRIELDFNPPAWGAMEEDQPVSYYTIKAFNGNEYIDITDFQLHYGSEVVDGVERAKYEITSQIPGTYDFENRAFYYKTVTGSPAKGESQYPVVLTWHHKVAAGYYTDGTANVAEPNEWEFIVEAHYAANNRYITKSEEAKTELSADLVVTGVEVIGSNDASSLKVYPIPAQTTITIKAAEAINKVVIYNEAGAEVMNVATDGDTMTEVNVENLVAGFYFVKVNNYDPVKIIKK